MGTWYVNSYGYPNPFQQSASAQGSWEMFESFVGRSGYQSVKDFWESHPSRHVKPQTVESWKATFEEFGLLYVLSGSGKVVITSGGQQIVAAAEAQDEREFAWIGMNLLLRYPLRGETGRRSSGPEFEQSDLLLYWFLHASLVELDGFWQQELFRILGRVFRRSEALGAVDLVKSLRRGEADINDYPDPSEGKTGGVYNALNQVMVHGSLSHMLFTSDKQDSPYFLDTRENWWHLNDDHRDLIRLALGEPKQAVPNGCTMPAPLTQRMPAAQSFSDEEEYFAYAGAAVDTLVVAEEQAQAATTPAVEYGGETVWLLTADRHFTRLDTTTVVGPVNALCVLSLEQRVVLSDELGYTYIVEEKQLTTDEVRVRLRRARPILDREYVVALFEETEDA